MKVFILKILKCALNIPHYFLNDLVVGVLRLNGGCNLFVFAFAQIEELGSEGRVEEAQGMMKLVEQLKEERELLSSTPSVSQLTPG